MSEHDDLRVRLARLDPAPSLDPVESPRAHELLERTMATPDIEPRHDDATRSEPGRRRVLAWSAAAVVLAAGSALAGIALQDDDTVGTKAPTTLALTLPSSSVMASCVQFDVQFLRDMSPAFAGTVTLVDAKHVVLDVDHWYAGGPADQVSLTVPGENTSASLDGVDFEQGKRYLVTAAEGTVNGCGFTGLATPQYESSFEQAFGG